MANKEISDLYREYSRVIDMCKGTFVDPIICWKFKGCIHNKIPIFIDQPEAYEFALCIVEDRPIFTGDTIYYKGVATVVNEFQLSLDLITWFALNKGLCSWHESEKTKTLLESEYYQLIKLMVDWWTCTHDDSQFFNEAVRACPKLAGAFNDFYRKNTDLKNHVTVASVSTSFGEVHLKLTKSDTNGAVSAEVINEVRACKDALLE